MPTQSITRKSMWLLFVSCGLSLLSSFGCASTQNGIPTGEWSGTGVYVDNEALAKSKPDELEQSRSKDGVYDTSLKISRQEMYGREVLVFDILSKRGELINVGDKESHVEFILVPLDRLEHGARQYACCPWAYNEDNKKPVSKKDFDKYLQFALASCIHQDGADVLQVTYDNPSKSNPFIFLDTFVFKGDRVCKTGRVIFWKEDQKKNEPKQEKLAMVYWAETLRKVK